MIHSDIGYLFLPPNASEGRLLVHVDRDLVDNDWSVAWIPAKPHEMPELSRAVWDDIGSWTLWLKGSKAKKLRSTYCPRAYPAVDYYWKEDEETGLAFPGYARKLLGRISAFQGVQGFDPEELPDLKEFWRGPHIGFFGCSWSPGMVISGVWAPREGQEPTLLRLKIDELDTVLRNSYHEGGANALLAFMDQESPGWSNPLHSWGMMSHSALIIGDS